MKLQETAGSMSVAIGKRGMLQSDKMRFEVEIIDVKQAFGRTDYLVQPVAGMDMAWVSSDRVKVAA